MNHNVLDRVLRSPRLPSLPTIALDVIDLTQQPNVHIDRIADTIRHDPALSSRILKTVNTSFYGQSQTITTISRALVVLRLNAVKILALGFSLVGNIKRTANDGFDHIGIGAGAFTRRPPHRPSASGRGSSIAKRPSSAAYSKTWVSSPWVRPWVKSTHGS